MGLRLRTQCFGCKVPTERQRHSASGLRLLKTWNGRLWCASVDKSLLASVSAKISSQLTSEEAMWLASHKIRAWSYLRHSEHGISCLAPAVSSSLPLALATMFRILQSHPLNPCHRIQDPPPSSFVKHSTPFHILLPLREAPWPRFDLVPDLIRSHLTTSGPLIFLFLEAPFWRSIGP